VAATLAGLTRAALTLASRNLLEHRMRSGVALAGIVFALFLALLQVGLLLAARHQASRLFEFFAFDLVLLSRDYQILYTAPPFDRARLVQAQAHPEVAAGFVLNVDRSHWTAAQTGQRSSLLLFGLDRDPAFLAEPALRDGLAALAARGAVLVDAFSHDDYGRLETGATGQVAGREVRIAGHFGLGLFFYAEGSALTGNAFFRELSGAASRAVGFGLLRLTPGADAEAVRATLRGQLPDDVRILTRQELIDQERDYFTTVKPTGLMFLSGALMAVLVSVAIFMQVMTSDILRRLPSYATLRAQGFSGGFVHAVAGLQSLLLGLAGFLPAYGLAWLAARLIVALTHLPLAFDASTVSVLFTLFACSGALSLLAALHRLRRIEPAELFHA
jgi:putative ABC transport system permease protein